MLKDHVCLLDFLHQKINHKQKKYIIVYDENNSCFVKCSDFCQGAFATVKKPVDPAKLQFIIQSAVAQIIRFEKNKGVTVPLFDLLDLPISEIARKMILITYRRCGESFNLKILAN